MCDDIIGSEIGLDCFDIQRTWFDFEYWFSKILNVKLNVNPSLCIFHDLLQEDQGAVFFINYTEETCT